MSEFTLEVRYAILLEEKEFWRGRYAVCRDEEEEEKRRLTALRVETGKESSARAISIPWLTQCRSERAQANKRLISLSETIGKHPHQSKCANFSCTFVLSSSLETRVQANMQTICFVPLVIDRSDKSRKEVVHITNLWCIIRCSRF